MITTFFSSYRLTIGILASLQSVFASSKAGELSRAPLKHSSDHMTLLLFSWGLLHAGLGWSLDFLAWPRKPAHVTFSCCSPFLSLPCLQPEVLYLLHVWPPVLTLDAFLDWDTPLLPFLWDWLLTLWNFPQTCFFLEAFPGFPHSYLDWSLS